MLISRIMRVASGGLNNLHSYICKSKLMGKHLLPSPCICLSSRRQTLLDSLGSGLIPTYIYFSATSETVKIHPTFDLHFLCFFFLPCWFRMFKNIPFYLCALILSLPLWNNSHNLSAKVPFSTPFPSAAGSPLNCLTLSGWKTFPGL